MFLGLCFVSWFVFLFLGFCVALGVSVVLGVGGPGDRVAWGGPEQTAVQFSVAVALRYHVVCIFYV